MTEPDIDLLGTIDPTLDVDDPSAVTAAIRDFQVLAGLDPTGRWNQSTAEAAEATVEWAAATAELAGSLPTLQRGDVGDEVRQLQGLVQAPPTGVFDADTERRVRRIQGAKGLPQTGIADGDLYSALGS